MFRKLATGFTALLCAAFLTVSAFAHPGNTDSSGGHYNRSTGEYHYHHGYPAHQHTNGKCPYDYDDKTSQNSGSSGSYPSTPSKPADSPAPQQPNQPSSQQVPHTSQFDFSQVPTGAWVFLAMLLSGIFMYAVSFPRNRDTRSPPQSTTSGPRPFPQVFSTAPPRRSPSPSLPTSSDPAPLPEPPLEPAPLPERISPPEPVAPPQPRPQKTSIPMHDTDSSAISHWGYDPYTQRLFIRMRDSGILYAYYDVPYEVALDLRYAPSVGQYYNASIKGKYRSRNHGYKELTNNPPLS